MPDMPYEDSTTTIHMHFGMKGESATVTGHVLLKEGMRFLRSTPPITIHKLHPETCKLREGKESPPVRQKGATASNPSPMPTVDVTPTLPRNVSPSLTVGRLL